LSFFNNYNSLLIIILIIIIIIFFIIICEIRYKEHLRITQKINLTILLSFITYRTRSNIIIRFVNRLVIQKYLASYSISMTNCRPIETFKTKNVNYWHVIRNDMLKILCQHVSSPWSPIISVKVGKELFFYEAFVENHFVPFSFLLLLR